MSNKHTRSKRNFSLPELRRKGQNSIRSFTRKELATFLSLFFIAIVTLLWIIGILNAKGSTDVPIRAGSLREGIIGTPRFVNPVLAVSDADKDMVALVYSGLMRLDQTGHPVPDLAESVSVSPDGKTYTFIIREDAYFHDGSRVTANDVVYTISQIQNPLIDSPKKASWQGITIKAVDEKTVTFELAKPFSPFLELATVGVLPSGLWQDLSLEEFSFSALNINAVGSGPYKISSVNRNESGIADEFILAPYRKFSLGKPYISRLTIVSYANERELGNALARGDISVASGLSPERAQTLAERGGHISSQSLPRVFGLFLNKSASSVLGDPAVIQAMKAGINKQEIIEKVLYGYGLPINGPIPKVFGSPEQGADETLSDQNAIEILEKAGWRLGDDGIRIKTDVKNKSSSVLSFSISTADTPELVATADIIKENLEALGFLIEVKIYSLGDLNQDIIRPRNYEALLFGQFVTDTGSLYAFWHSSQTRDPGLNVAQHKSTLTDNALTDLFSATTAEDRTKALGKLSDDIEKNAPVIFLYSPLYLEAHNGVMKTPERPEIVSPADRFRNVHTWYLETEKVWKFLIKN